MAGLVPVLLGGVVATAPAAADTGREPTPVARAHAHNDYEHDRPLLDALDQGFSSVEADVWLVDGELRVAHDLAATVPGRSLESLYLGPLAERVGQHDGTVYDGQPQTFHLLIDVKSAAGPTYAAVDTALRRHPDLFTTFTGPDVQGGPVTATISGNRDLATMAAQPDRLAAYDGRLTDLASDAPATLIPLVSDDWTATFTWLGVGPMPAAERTRLREAVATAHRDGRRVRFYATPDEPGPAREAVWREELAAGVDFLNTDHLADLRSYLLANDEDPSTPTVEWWAPR